MVCLVKSFNKILINCINIWIVKQFMNYFIIIVGSLLTSFCDVCDNCSRNALRDKCIWNHWQNTDSNYLNEVIFFHVPSYSTENSNQPFIRHKKAWRYWCTIHPTWCLCCPMFGGVLLNIRSAERVNGKSTNKFYELPTRRNIHYSLVRWKLFYQHVMYQRDCHQLRQHRYRPEPVSIA